MDDDLRFMTRALALATRAAEIGEVPVGAVVVCDGEVVAEGMNEIELRRDGTAHAELIALQRCSAELRERRLNRATLYVTLEPCAMCAGACVWTRLGRLVYGAPDPRAGAVGTLYDIPRDTRLNHRVEVVAGVAADESAALLRRFFAQLRLAT
ncbi:MAG: tRNA adenosine(34) deaminase TadA [Planctomycetota bacterium]